MKKLLLSVMLAAGVSGQAAAADWTGWYVGAFGSRTEADSRANVALSGQWATESVALQSHVTNFWSTSFDTSNTGFGAQVGYDYQFSNKWVLGFSAEYADTSAEDSRQTLPTPTPPFPSLSYTAGNSIALGDSWGARARFGYGFENSLLYLSAGWTSMDVDSTAVLVSNGNYRKVGAASANEGTFSWGVGWEYAFNDHWSVQADYQKYSGMDDFSYATVYAPGSSFVTPAYNETFTQKLDADYSVRLGLNYRF